MSDHYCCKRCGLRYDDCTCPPLGGQKPPRKLPPSPVPSTYKEIADNLGNFGKPATDPSAKLDALLDGGFIERYHVKGQRMLVPQNVAEHSWRMAAVLFYILPTASARLVFATLFHDVSERVTGDVPSPVKRASEEVRKAFNKLSTEEERRLGIRFDLGPEEAKLLAWLDRYEGALHCLDELEMGNRKALHPLARYMEYCGGPEHSLVVEDVEERRMDLFVQLDQKVRNYLGDKV